MRWTNCRDIHLGVMRLKLDWQQGAVETECPQTTTKGAVTLKMMMVGVKNVSHTMTAIYKRFMHRRSSPSHSYSDRVQPAALPT